MMSWQSEFKTNLIVFDMFFSHFEGHIFKNNPEKQRFWLVKKYEVAKYLDLTHNFDRSMKLKKCVSRCDKHKCENFTLSIGKL